MFCSLIAKSRGAREQRDTDIWTLASPSLNHGSTGESASDGASVKWRSANDGMNGFTG